MLIWNDYSGIFPENGDSPVSETSFKITEWWVIIWNWSSYLKAESESLYDFILATRLLRITTSNFFFPIWTLADESVVYNCCWSSKAQAFSGPRPAGFMTHFTVSDSRLPQPGGPGPRIYIPHEQDCPVIPPGTGFQLKAEFLPNNIYIFRSYLIGNTLRLRHKDQPVNAV
jgi:hypothetical protein